MRRLIVLGAFLTIIINLSSRCEARVSLVHEKTFTVPGLAGPIRQIRFRDISGDGLPEALVRDGTTAVLYSITGDSLVWTHQADSLFVLGSAVLADVDRDSVPDVFLSERKVLQPSYPNQTTWKLECFSGPFGYARTSVDSLPLVADFCGSSECASNVAEAVDMDSDGYNELLFSVDSIHFDFASGMITEYSVGISRLYRSFPQSLDWNRPMTINRVMAIPDGPNGRRLIGAFRSYSYSELGPDREDDNVWSGFIDLLGQTEGLDGVNCPFSCYEGTRSRVATSEVAGDLSGQSPLVDILMLDRCYVRCVGVDLPAVDSRAMTLISLSPSGATEDRWSRDLGDTYYVNFAYHPSLPGSFFAFSGDTLLMLRGSDGSVRDRQTEVPTGTRYWDNPYDDGIPRLVVINGATVSLYHLDIATGVADDGRGTSLPANISLSDPYPNPFNPTVTFGIGTGGGGMMEMEIYNVAGQRVASLYHGRVAGNQDLVVEWNATGRASGVYIARLTIDDQKSVKKMILLK